MNNLTTYNSNDLLVRKAVAQGGLVKLAVRAVTNARAGSLDICKQRILEMAIAQYEYIKCHSPIKTSAMGVFKPLGNTGVDISTTLSVNGVIISDTFIFTSNKITTATNIAKAIESFTSVPEYTATVVGDEVRIQSVLLGTISNGYSITLDATPVEVTYEFIHFFGGQEGVLTEENRVSEAIMDKIFNNIAEVTGCGYAPLGTNYISL